MGARTYAKDLNTLYCIVLHSITITMMETISLRLEETFLRDLERIMKKYRYSTKTEFVRAAIRDKMGNIEKEELLMNLDKIAGKSKRKTTDEDLHKAREKLARIYENKFK